MYNMDAFDIIDLNTRFQAASICVFAVIVIDYIRGKKSRLAASKFFTIMLIVTGIYLAFDVASMFTLNLITDSFINKVVHQFYLLGIVTMVFSLSIYVEMTAHRFTNMSLPAKILWGLPYAACVIFIVLGKYEYTFEERVAYLAYGPLVYFIYFTLGFYILYVAWRSFSYSDVIPSKKCHALQIGTIIWAIFACVQMFTQFYLTSSLGIVLVILILYLSFENTGVNFDIQTGYFNAKVLDAMLNEHFRFSPEITIVNVTFTDMSLVSSNIGRKAATELTKKCCNYLSDLFGSHCYRYDDDTFTFIIDEKEPKIYQYMLILDERFLGTWEAEGIRTKVNVWVDVIKCPDFVSNTDEFYDLTKYMEVSHEKTGKRFQIADDEMIEAKKRHEKIRQVATDAVNNDGFEIFYQPIYSTEKKRFVSAEALVRLKDKTTVGYVSPEEFIPILEANGLILDLGEVIFRKVCSFAKQANLRELGVDYIEVNLSGVQAMDASLPERFKKIVSVAGLTPGFFNLEITETAAVSSGEMLHFNMDRLTDYGFSFSMDDFGTGYSNLSQIAETHYDLVKLDKSLIWPCYGENPNTEAMCILENVIIMLHSLGIHIVAEGVETKEMVESLTKYKVNYLQGYYFSRPIPEDEYVAFLKEKNMA